MSVPKQIDPATVTIGGAGDVLTTGGWVQSSVASDPTNWNITSNWQGPFTVSETLTADKLNRAVMSVEGGEWRCRVAPPNRLQRILWRALGVTWKDLRPERKLDELGKLK